MKLELEKQVIASKKAKEEEKRKEFSYMQQLQEVSLEQQRRDKLKQDEFKKKLDAEKLIRDQ